MFDGNVYTKATLDAGTLIFPVSTDGDTYLNFRLENYEQGRIIYTITDYERFIDGINEYDCFEEVPYSG